MAAIDITRVQTVKNDIHSDLIVSMSGVTAADLIALGVVNIIRGVENEDTKIVYVGNRNVANRYNASKQYHGKLGRAVERKLKVTNVISYIPDNLQNYREKIGQSIAGLSSNGAAATDLIEQRLRFQAFAFGNQVISNFFHGDASLGETHPYGLYDGLLKDIKKDMKAADGGTATDELALITEEAGNYIKLGVLDLSDKKAMYDKYIEFCQKLCPTLRRQAIVLTTEEVYNAVTRGYCENFVGNQSGIINNLTDNDFKSHEAGGAILRKVSTLGKGTGFIATINGNVDYATDLTGSEEPGDAFITVEKNGEDPLNTLLLGMQCASAVRLIDFNKEAFACSELNFTPEDIEDQELQEVETASIDMDAIDAMVNAKVDEKIAEILAAKGEGTDEP